MLVDAFDTSQIIWPNSIENPFSALNPDSRWMMAQEYFISTGTDPNNANLKADGLVVKEAVVGEGPTIKRFMARARGSASRILKRTSHIRIVLSDEIAIETRQTRKAKRDQEKKAAGKEEVGKGSTAGKKPKARKKPAKKTKK